MDNATKPATKPALKTIQVRKLKVKTQIKAAQSKSRYGSAMY